TFRKTVPAAASLRVIRMVKVLSPAATSPSSPSSCRVPRIAMRLPPESRRCRLTEPGMSEASATMAVTVTVVGAPAKMLPGVADAEVTPGAACSATAYVQALARASIARTRATIHMALLLSSLVDFRICGAARDYVERDRDREGAIGREIRGNG